MIYRSIKQKQIYSFLGILVLVIMGSVVSVVNAEYSKRDFGLNQETVVYLEIDSDKYYNASIIVSVTSGVGVNATVNGITKEVAVNGSEEFTVFNKTTINFSITSEGLSIGFFELELIELSNEGGRNPIRTTIGIVAVFLLLLSGITYVIRAKRMEPKEDEEDSETDDPEVARKRREAAGAEKKFWGLDEK